MATTPIHDDYDFGFSFADEESVSAASSPAPPANNDELILLQQKVDAILMSQNDDKYTKLIEDKYKAKLREVESLILPLLSNLMKNPEKAYINWPNREAVIKKQIDKITAVTRS